jgi:hypothetical protein
MKNSFRFTPLLLVSFLLSCGVSGPSSSQQDSDLNDVWNLYHQERYLEAEAGFLDFAWYDVGAPEAWCGLGWSRMHLGSFSQARQAFSQSLLADPSYLDSRAGDAFAQRQDGAASRLIQQARFVLTDEPVWSFEHELGVNHLDLRVVGAQAWFLQQDFDSCLIWLQGVDTGLALSRLDTLSWAGADDFESALLAELERIAFEVAP